MKVAITAQGTELSSPVDPRFGRAKMFVIYDLDTDQFDVVDNQQNLTAAQGAGIQAAESVARHAVDYVLTGHCGPKAFRALDAAGVKVVAGLQGSVQEAIDKFRAGELKPAARADVQGHWK